MRRRQVLDRLAATVAALAFVGAAAAGVVVADAPASYAASSRALVIVDTGSGVHRSVISFNGTVSGLQALQLAGANPVTVGYSGQGSAICQLYGVGHDASSGSCLGTLDDARYWAYFRSPAGTNGFSYSGAGAGSTVVHDGDVEGWRFGTGQAPAYSSFCSVAGCAPPPTAPPPTALPAPAAPASPPPSAVQGTSVISGQGGAAGAAPGATGSGSGGSASTAPGGGKASSSGGTGPGASTTAAPGGSDGSSSTTSKDHSAQKADERASAAKKSGSGGDSGGGSPWGVVGAVVLVVALGAGGWWLRRRRMATSPG